MSLTLKDLLAAAKDNTLPEVLGAEGVNLTEARKSAVDRFKELNDGEHTDEALAEMETLAAIAKAANLKIKENQAAQAAASEREGKAKTLADEVADLDDDEDDEDGGLEGEVLDAAPPAPLEQKELVVAAGKKVDLSRLPSNRVPAVKDDKTPAYTITAAADIPGYSTGSQLGGLADIAAAYASKMTGLSRLGSGKSVSAPIVSIRRNRRPELAIGKPGSDGFADASAAVKYATDFSRFGSVENLVAAGGWCAPSETIYDLCPPAAMDGLVDIPEVPAPRGGIRFPAGLDFSAIYNGGFHQTEAQAIAGTTKPCVSIPCPTFTDVRLDVDGFCVEAPILTDTAYPELVQNFIANVLAAHVHRINAFKLARMVALSTANTVTPVPDFGAASTALEYIELHAEWIRYAHRLGVNTVLEVVLPLWARGALRNDLAKKNGVELFDVSDAQLEAYFAVRHLRVQWVYDWQDALTTGVATAFGGATIQDTWPSTMQVLIYPAGTFFAPTTDVITLDSIYDSTGLSTNTFTRLFTEEGIQVAKQCFTSYVVTLPVCTAGGSGAQYAPDCANATQLPAAA